MTTCSLLDHFSVLEDPRVERTRRYPLEEILLLVISAVLSGCNGWSSIKQFGEIKLSWLRRYLPYKDGIPVDDTIARLMRKLDPKTFQSCFVSWMQSVVELSHGEIIALDGKTARGSRDGEQNPLHMVSAWSAANGVVLGQESTAEKSNEITAIPKLLDTLAIKGCLVTIDAMGCQKEIAKQIINKKSDYLLALKGNQGHLHDDVKDFFYKGLEDDFKGISHDYYIDIDKGHGRIEQRECWVVEIKNHEGCFSNAEKWKNLTSIIMIRSTRLDKGKESKQTRFYISSINANAERLLAGTRKHWGIENNLHWVLDLTFKEDESRIRKDLSSENFAVIRHIAYNLIKKDHSSKGSVRSKRERAAFDDDYRDTLLKQVTQL